jgi:hypothetical protein
MRGFALGLIVIVGIGLTVLSIRPGGLRRQLRLAARRFRIALALGGIWLLASLAGRVAFPNGPVSDYGPAVLAILLGAVFIFLGQDPDQSITTRP